MPTVLPLTLALFASVALGSAAAILAWRQRPEPGAVPLVALLVGQSWWSTCIIFKLQATGVESKIFWIDLAWVGVVVIPVAWLLFALEYTGHDRYATPRYIALLSVIPALTVVFTLTSQYHDLMYIVPRDVGPNGVLHLEQGGIWFWVIAEYTYLLGFLGMVPLLDLLTSDPVTFRGQGTALLVGLVVPWVTNILFLTGYLPTSGIDPTPIAFSISGVAYLNAITRFRLLGTSPAPNKRARRLLFDRMREGAIVVDSNDYVVDMNDGALDILDLHPHEALTSPANEVIPEYDRLPDEGVLSGHLTIDGESGEERYDVTVAEINNVRNRTIGRAITLHDVSQHLRQQQRLEVLNRVLRHNIGTETNVILGQADQVVDRDVARIIRDRAMQIADIGEKGREAIELFERGREEPSPKPVGEILERSITTAREEYPSVTVEFGRPDDSLAVAALLTPVFSNVIENAAEHNTSDDPHVRVTAHPHDDRVRITIADNGPGIEDYEISVLDEGTETALRHGSGLGLWIIKWGTEIADGHVRFDENEPTGTVVTIDVPRLPADDADA